MLVRAKQSWLRRTGVAVAALATVALCIGTLARPSAAQVYPGYSSAPSQTYSSGYSTPGAAAPTQGYPGYGYSGAYPGYGYSGAYPGYGYSAAYPYYPYPYGGWGWPGWGWPGITVGFGWGGRWGGRGCWNCGFRGGFHGGFAHAGFQGGGFHGSGGGFGGHR